MSRRFLLLYGAACALLGMLALHVAAPDPLWIMGTRAQELQRATTGLAEHGLPLYAELPGIGPWAVGTTDDQGIYVLVSYVALWTGSDDPLAVFRGIWLVAWGITFLSYPFVFARLFSSRLAALMAPLAAIVAVGSFLFDDIYWVQAWAVMTLIPPVLLLWRKERLGRADLGLLLVLALTASAVTAIRSNAGLPVLAAIVVVLVARLRPWWQTAIAVVVALAAYTSISGYGLEALRDYRDARAPVDLSAGAPDAHPFWHSAYIGLGYFENDHEIWYDDSIAAQAAREKVPNARYLSPAYDRALREETLDIVTAEPGFVLASALKKAVQAVKHALPYLLLLLLVWTALWRRRDLRAPVLLVVPALLVGLLAALVVVPYRPYLLGTLGGLALLGLLGMGAVADGVEERWSREGGGRGRRAVHAAMAILPAVSRPRLALAAVAAVAVAALVVLGGRAVQREHERWDARKPAIETVRDVQLGRGG